MDRTATRTAPRNNSILARQAIACAVAAAAALTAHSASAAVNLWNGAGVSANTGSNWDAIANYTGAGSFTTSNDLDYSSINSVLPVTLGSTTVGTINANKIIFGTTSSTIATPVTVNINGTGTAGQTILNVAGGITLPSPTLSKVTFGSDLTVNLTSATHAVGYAQNNSVTVSPPTLPVLVLKSKLTGGGAASVLSSVFSTIGYTGSAVVSATPAIVLTNNASTVDTTISAGGQFSYTSINNSGAGAGASSIGTSSASTGGIGLSGGNFAYIGAVDQSTNRAITFSGAGTLANYASAASNLTFSGTFASTAASSPTLGFGVSNGNTITVSSVIGNSTGTGTPVTNLIKKSSNAYFNSDGTLGAADGSGTLILTKANTYTGLTTVAGGTLQVGNATTGSLNGTTGTALTFNTSGGTFNINEASGVSQGMGTLTFGAGNGIVQSTNNGGNSFVTFSSLAARASGASGNFVTTNGTNGSTNKIAITGQATGFMNQGLFYGGDNYAYYDATGYVRGINYGVDAGSALNAGATSAASVANLRTTGNITAQATGTAFTTLNLYGTTNFALANSAVVTVNSILKSGGGSSIISGSGAGVGIQTTASSDLNIDTDLATDILTINAPMLNNTTTLVKSGAGKLVLGFSTGTGYNAMYLNGGTIQITNANAYIGGYSLQMNNGTLEYTTGTITTNNRALILNGAAALQVDAGSTLKLATAASVTLSTSNLSINGDGNTGISTIISSTGGGIIKSGNGTLTLSGANTYVGTTTINGGTVIVGDGTGGSLGNTTVAVNSSGKLGGVGSIGGSVTVNGSGVLAPGNGGIGTLSVGSLDVSAIAGTGGLNFDLGTTGNNDKISTTGLLTLGTLDFNDFSFAKLATLVGGESYTLLHGGAISGILGTATGSLGAGATGTLSFSGGTDVILTVAVPEPASLGLIALAGGGLLVRRRRAIAS